MFFQLFKEMLKIRKFSNEAIRAQRVLDRSEDSIKRVEDGLDYFIKEDANCPPLILHH